MEKSICLFALGQLLIGSFMLFAYSTTTLAEQTADCPETLLIDFSRKVSDRKVAIELFSEYFSTDKGFPAFQEEMLKGPYNSDPSVPDGTFSYFDWYGQGPNKLGGLLYPDGRLVQRGYCK